MFDSLTTLLARQDQVFECCPTAHSGAVGYTHHVKVHHEVGAPLDATQLALLLVHTNEIEQLAVLYARYGHLSLYCGQGSKVGAFHLAPVDEWPVLEDLLNDYFADLAPHERAALLPEWIDHVAVIGQVPHTGNYFVVPIKGADHGKVFEFIQDGFEWIERGKDIASFIDWLCTVDTALLKTIGTNTYYSDGVTDVHWAPQCYQASGVSPVALKDDQQSQADFDDEFSRTLSMLQASINALR